MLAGNPSGGGTSKGPRTIWGVEPKPEPWVWWYPSDEVHRRQNAKYLAEALSWAESAKPRVWYEGQG